MTTMTLLEEIQAKCPADMIAARDDYSIAQLVNVGRVAAGPVSAATVRGLMYAMGAWAGIVARANAARANADASPVALACQTLYDLSVAGHLIPMDTPAIAARVSQDLDLMVDAGLLTAQQKAAVLSLASTPNPVTVDQVSDALSAAGRG